MQTVTEYSEYILDDVLMVTHQLIASPSSGVNTALSEMGAALLRALSSMAQISRRHQAVVDEALHRASLSVSADTMANVLRELVEQNCIGGLIPLSDGALLLTVTAVGMSRAVIG